METGEAAGLSAAATAALLAMIRWLEIRLRFRNGGTNSSRQSPDRLGIEASLRLNKIDDLLGRLIVLEEKTQALLDILREDMREESQHRSERHRQIIDALRNPSG